jgi:hypothetical protein
MRRNDFETSVSSEVLAGTKLEARACIMKESKNRPVTHNHSPPVGLHIPKRADELSFLVVAGQRSDWRGES